MSRPRKPTLRGAAARGIGRFHTKWRFDLRTGGVHYVVFKDRATGAYGSANIGANGVPAPEPWSEPTPPAISGTGRFVAFQFGDVNLVPDDVNKVRDVFLRDSGPNVAPAASFTTTVGVAGDPLALMVDAAPASDPDGWIESYAWTFGQGGTATGPTGVFRYSASGTYTVTLTVTDNDGATATASQTVTIKAPPPPPPRPLPAQPPPPPPRPAAPRKLLATVGPAAKITVTTLAGRKMSAIVQGRVSLLVRDRTNRDNFHLTGPGVNRKTGVAAKASVTWLLTLRPGVYSFRSDAHPKTLRSSFKVTKQTSGRK